MNFERIQKINLECLKLILNMLLDLMTEALVQKFIYTNTTAFY